LREESGYTLVEVIVSIIILAIAILPMVGMFDMGLRSATSSGKYDKARNLANLKMEEAKSLSFSNVRDNFPVTGSAPDTTTGYYDSGFMPESGPASADFPNPPFQYRVEKQYMVKLPQTPRSSSWSFDTCENDTPSSTCNTGTNPIRLTVTVQWDGNEYSVYGLVTE